MIDISKNELKQIKNSERDHLLKITLKTMRQPVNISRI